MAELRKYFTTPIYYVNDRPHIGHAYCSILTDTFARYARLFGSETYFLTGVDEHGQKVQNAAEKRGIHPKAHVDELQESFRTLLPQLHVENDDFIRTTEPRHTKVVQRVLQELFDRGDIYQSTYEGWYSERAERFWTEKDLVDGKCPDTGGEVERVQEQSYFFRMSRYQDQLIAHMEENKDWVVPRSRWQEVRSFLKQPLLDLCISRPVERLSWGIPLPFDENCVTYVWFDALTNYISGIGRYVDEERFQKWWPHAHHFIGKDILTTHAVYWGTMLMAMELPLPRQICATGWWLVDNTKMSKSLGNVVDPLSLKDKYGPDVLRYFLMREMAVGQDASFSEEAVVRRNNSDLANDLGNLLRRTLALVRKGFDGKIPPKGPSEDLDKEVQELMEGLPGRVLTLLNAHRMHESIEECLQVVRALNRYIDRTAPFKVIKEDPARAGEVLRNILEGLHIVSTMLHPVMPRKMEEMLARIGVEARVDTADQLRFGMLKAGTAIGSGDPIFPRQEFIAPETVETDTPKNKKAAKKKKAPKEAGEISFDDFMKLDLRVAKILEAVNVEGSKKLIKLTVDAGEEQPRQVVSGIAESYEATDLPGTFILLVANLAPKKIFGVQSHGMALLAETKDRLTFVQPAQEVAPGTKVR